MWRSSLGYSQLKCLNFSMIESSFWILQIGLGSSNLNINEWFSIRSFITKNRWSVSYCRLISESTTKTRLEWAETEIFKKVVNTSKIHFKAKYLKINHTINRTWDNVFLLFRMNNNEWIHFISLHFVSFWNTWELILIQQSRILNRPEIESYEPQHKYSIDSMLNINHFLLH